MDPSALKALRTLMHDLESLAKDPEMRSASPDRAVAVDPASLTLRYPDNVMVVSFKNYDDFPRFPGEVLRCGRLYDAVDTIATFLEKRRLQAGPSESQDHNFSGGEFKKKNGEKTTSPTKTGRVDGISIVVDEGVYVDNLGLTYHLRHFSVEIIGVKNVVIASFRSGQISLHDVDISWKNVTIYDATYLWKRIDPYASANQPCVSIFEGASVEMTDVRIRSPATRCFHVEGSRSRLNLDRCSLTKSFSCFIIFDGGLMTVSRCRFADITELCGFASTNSSLCVTDTKFIDAKTLQIFLKSRATFRDCHFRGRGPASGQICLSVDTESFAALRDTTLERLAVAIAVTKRSKLQMRQSRVEDCKTAMSTHLTVYLTVEDSLFSSLDCLLMMEGSAAGRADFKRNRHVGDNPPVFYRYGPSLKLDHDFDKVWFGERPTPDAAHMVRWEGKDFDEVPVSSGGVRRKNVSKKDRSVYTKHKQETLRKDGGLHPNMFDKRYKYCERCRKQQIDPINCDHPGPCRHEKEAEAGPVDGPRFLKYKYCKKCDYCYCSEKCQKDDWEDHKLVCGIKTSFRD